jgi:methyl-accepting chemotaxis protein
MTIKKKGFFSGLGLGLVLILLVGGGIYSIKTISNSTSQIQDIFTEELHKSEIITIHEKYAMDLTASIMSQKDFGGGLDPHKCMLGEWWYPFKETPEFAALDPELKDAMLKMEVAHESIHKLAKSYKEKYIKYDKDLEGLIFNKQIEMLKMGSDLIESITTKKVTKVNENPEKTGFGRWYKRYLTSEEYGKLTPKLQELIKAMGVPHQQLHETISELKKFEKAGDFEAAQDVYVSKTVVALDKVIQSMRAIIERLQIDKRDNMDIEDAVLGALPVNLKTVVSGLEAYNDVLDKREHHVVSSKDALVSITNIASIIIGILAALIIGGVILMNRAIVNSIVGFQKNIESFFRYLNKETDQVVKLVEGDDEIGQMSAEVNVNIDRIVDNVQNEHKLIMQVNELVNTVKSGDLTKRVNANIDNEALTKLKDELNTMVDQMEIKMGSDINSINAVLNSFAAYDFRPEVKGRKGEVKDNINKVGKLIETMLGNNQGNAFALQKVANELRDNIGGLNVSTNEQAASLEEVAASIEEISGNIRNNGDKANQLAKIASNMSKLTTTGSEKISQMTGMIAKVADSQRAIDNAIKIIDQIAFQTNILSLNAAVEAATAGEHGRGFAVVATEVRNLAAKSADAANEIKALVSTGTELVENSTTLSRDVDESFSELVNSITETAQFINEITEASNEQSIAITQISETMNSLDTMTQNNASMANNSNEITMHAAGIASDIMAEIKDKQFNGKK